jgi:Trm5-related predicted tRNA methylase
MDFDSLDAHTDEEKNDDARKVQKIYTELRKYLDCHSKSLTHTGFVQGLT